jgi:hypothetical protein
VNRRPFEAGKHVAAQPRAAFTIISALPVLFAVLVGCCAC